MIITLGAAQALTIGCFLVRTKITAVLVGPAGVGLVSVIDQVVAVITQVSLLTLPFASVKYLSAAHSRDHEAFARGFVAFLRAILTISLVGTAGGMALVLIRPALLGRELSGQLWVVVVALMAIPLTGLTGLLTNTMAAAGRMGESALFGFLLAASATTMSSGGIWLAGLPGYYVGALVGTSAVVAGGLIFLRGKEHLRIVDRSVPVLAELRRDPATLNFALASYVASFTAPLAFLIVRFAVLDSLGAQGAGLLHAAMGMALALGSVMRSSGGLFLAPAMNRADPPETKYRIATQYLSSLIVLTSLAALPIVLFPQMWVTAVYSGEFATAAPFVHLFVLTQILLLMTGVNSGLLVGLNRIRAHVSIVIAGDVVVAALSWVLVPSYGLAGVGVAMTVGAALEFGLTAVRLWRYEGMPIYRALGGYPGVAVLAVALLGFGVAHLGIGPLDQIVPKILLFAAFGAASLWYLRGKRGGGDTSGPSAAASEALSS